MPTKKRTFVTFGQEHRHEVNGQTYDRNCVAVIYCDSPQHGRELAFSTFGPKFAFEHHEDEFNHGSMSYYHRGFIEVNPEDKES